MRFRTVSGELYWLESLRRRPAPDMTCEGAGQKRKRIRIAASEAQAIPKEIELREEELYE